MLSFINKRLFSSAAKHSKFLVIGGGTGGLNFVSQMRREKGITDGDFTVFEPSAVHYYQVNFKHGPLCARPS